MSFSINKPKIPKKYHPRGFEIIHEDLDIIVVNKYSGTLSVSALWNKNDTVQSALNNYIRKGNQKSTKSVYTVHRLDQATSGILLFAKTETTQNFLKNNWSHNIKTYHTIVHGTVKKKEGLIESYLEEDEEYFVHSHADKNKGKLARTEYKVLKETDKLSLIQINLITGKKNQIRVHMAELGAPIVGDTKYGIKSDKNKNLMLHSTKIEITHPFKKERVLFTAPFPKYFTNLIDFSI